MHGEHPGAVIRQIPDGSWISADGRWLWRGGRWVPLPLVVGAPRLSWFTGAPSWFPTLMVLGLIGLIPIAGAMNLYGYALTTARNLRAGYRVLPPANFSFIAVGAPAAVWAIMWSLIAFLLFVGAGLGVGLVAYQQAHDWVWTIALAFAGGATAAILISTPVRILLVPALEVSSREGWALFRTDLFRFAREHWRGTWYGATVLLFWSGIYLVISVVAGVVPFGGILAAMAGIAIMAPLLAVVLARFDDPPAGFTQGWANAVAWAVAGLSLLAIVLVWAATLAAVSYISRHPEVATCFTPPGCGTA